MRNPFIISLLLFVGSLLAKPTIDNSPDINLQNTKSDNQTNSDYKRLRPWKDDFSKVKLTYEKLTEVKISDSKINASLMQIQDELHVLEQLISEKLKKPQIGKDRSQVEGVTLSEKDPLPELTSQGEIKSEDSNPIEPISNKLSPEEKPTWNIWFYLSLASLLIAIASLGYLFYKNRPTNKPSPISRSIENFTHKDTNSNPLEYDFRDKYRIAKSDLNVAQSEIEKLKRDLAELRQQQKNVATVINSTQQIQPLQNKPPLYCSIPDASLFIPDSKIKTSKTREYYEIHERNGKFIFSLNEESKKETLQNKDMILEPGCEITGDRYGKSDISMVSHGELEKISGGFRVIKKIKVKVV